MFRNKNKSLLTNRHLNGPLLVHMRDVAFGNNTQRHTNNTLEHAIRLRDDESLLDKAQEKRLRKMVKRQHTE